MHASKHCEVSALQPSSPSWKVQYWRWQTAQLHVALLGGRGESDEAHRGDLIPQTPQIANWEASHAPVSAGTGATLSPQTGQWSEISSSPETQPMAAISRAAWPSSSCMCREQTAKLAVAQAAARRRGSVGSPETSCIAATMWCVRSSMSFRSMALIFPSRSSASVEVQASAGSHTRPASRRRAVATCSALQQSKPLWGPPSWASPSTRLTPKPASTEQPGIPTAALRRKMGPSSQARTSCSCAHQSMVAGSGFVSSCGTAMAVVSLGTCTPGSRANLRCCTSDQPTGCTPAATATSHSSAGRILPLLSSSTASALLAWLA
mmetsp:Transcript_12411/g.34841  ORF Transcript_12411/g.34841 Transcript_12411/m.34841 type:complete len:321 (-) Transcript_12411:1373-2335(-)